MEFNYKTIIKEKNKQIKNILNKCEKKDKEIERLNTIINEIEKYIDEKNKIKIETDGYIWQFKRPSITCKDLKKKLQELKGDSSNE